MVLRPRRKQMKSRAAATAHALLNGAAMTKLATLALSMAGVLAGCVTDDDRAEDPPVPPAEMSTEEMNNPAPIEPVVTIDRAMSEVIEIARMDRLGLADAVAAQIRLVGTFEAAGGSELAIGVDAGERNGHPISNYGSWSWNTPSIHSDDYSNGSCGSWEALRTTRGLICRAPGDASTRQKTTWSYAQLESFELADDGGASFDFYVTAYDRWNRELLCNRVLVTQSDPYGAPSTTYPACP
jgi:hypothetical protein